MPNYASSVQRAFRHWRHFAEESKVAEMKSGLEGQKAFLAGEISKLRVRLR